MQFVFCTCQPGAEGALKREVAHRASEWRFAYSQSGLVTFKLPEPTTIEAFAAPRLVFARTLGLSAAQVKPESGATSSSRPTVGESLDPMTQALWETPGLRELAQAATTLHVWTRDPGVPGDRGYEPGQTDTDLETRQAILDSAPEGNTLGRGLQTGGVVMDVIRMAPGWWWVGCHRAAARYERWPGGTPPLDTPEAMISRAYLKIAEALRWSALPAEAGDQWVELGASPGGASQALLDRGMKVIGVDPAVVDPSLEENPNFRHLRRRVMDAPRRDFIGCRWLAADLNVAPRYTLDAVEALVARPDSTIRGMLLTLKLADWELAAPEKLSEYAQRVQGWGFRDVRFRQLAHNRQELCMAALKSRSQRRLRR
ncbi:putative 23S rRNA ribose 2'-O-ribose methyltransferase [Pirellulimonas nuda]|uniref:Putative 23S rRNA ribose 2'-O-ribose methyltransferase n=1 Tax=Pirellulimonas nuda TaxID=2528009 RepID=A0A518DF16_9BACT|nr:SAM-dependent methyltransferase [Pirellulimonas nuda]QDU90050.1 putative 23S rRNA ribose 2'-O-ribose methyltransferase [Pirellulimonas nuda]